MRLTKKDSAALWCVFFAMRMRFNGRRPPRPTKEQWAKIHAARTVYVGKLHKNTWDKLESNGLITRERGSVLYLTPKGFETLGAPVPEVCVTGFET